MNGLPEHALNDALTAAQGPAIKDRVAAALARLKRHREQQADSNTPEAPASSAPVVARESGADELRPVNMPPANRDGEVRSISTKIRNGVLADQVDLEAELNGCRFINEADRSMLREQLEHAA